MSNPLCSLVRYYNCFLHGLKQFDGLGPLALRLYLGPVFVFAGWKKIVGIEDTIAWFGNPDWGLGLPLPELMAWLASLAEFGGGIALLLGLGVRFFSVPLMITMLVAAFAVHWPNGWQAVADPGWLFANDRVLEASERLSRAREILRQYGNYDWLTGKGSIVILNNGIEFSITYFVMCLVLLFTGGGRYVSVDYWIAKRIDSAGRCDS